MDHTLEEMDAIIKEKQNKLAELVRSVKPDLDAALAERARLKIFVQYISRLPTRGNSRDALVFRAKEILNQK